MRVSKVDNPRLNLTDWSLLDEMIRQGYGDVPQWQLPENWRTVKLKDQKEWKPRYTVDAPAEVLDGDL